MNKTIHVSGVIGQTTLVHGKQSVMLWGERHDMHRLCSQSIPNMVTLFDHLMNSTGSFVFIAEGLLQRGNPLHEADTVARLIGEADNVATTCVCTLHQTTNGSVRHALQSCITSAHGPKCRVVAADWRDEHAPCVLLSIEDDEQRSILRHIELLGAFPDSHRPLPHEPKLECLVCYLHHRLQMIVKAHCSQAALDALDVVFETYIKTSSQWMSEMRLRRTSKDPSLFAAAMFMPLFDVVVVLLIAHELRDENNIQALCGDSHRKAIAQQLRVHGWKVVRDLAVRSGEKSCLELPD